MGNTTDTMRELRQLIPGEQLTSLADGVELAERLAALLLALVGSLQPGNDLRVLARSLGVEVSIATELAVSGMSERVKGRWHIVVRGRDHIAQRRFALAREFWMVILDGRDDVFSATDSGHIRKWMQECADSFAATLLMPKALIYPAWARGLREVPYLAAHFVVSPPDMTRRLLDIGLPAARTRRGASALQGAVADGVGL